MIEGWIETLSEMLQVSSAGGAAPWIALIAGVLTAFTPCALSTIPLVIGYVGGTAGGNTKKAFRLSLAFALGMAVTYTALGIAASIFGKMMGFAGKGWYIVLGVLMVLMALQLWEVWEIIPSTYLQTRNKRQGYIGAVSTGILSGIFSSPCSTPVLIVLLAYASKIENLWRAALLLLMYSLGHSILAILSGTFVGLVRKIIQSKKYGAVSKVLQIVSGALVLAVAIYMFYLGF